MLQPPTAWPPETQRVYRQLQSYELVGASACLAGIVGALRALAVASRSSPAVVLSVGRAADLFCALKPNTAAYRTAADWLIHDLNHASPEDAADAIARRAEAFLEYRAQSLERLVAAGRERLAGVSSLLIHDYSSSVLRLIARPPNGSRLSIFITWGQPLDQGPAVARLAAEQGHRVTLIPDTAIGRTMPEVGAVLSGVESLYADGSCANTVGTYPIALVAAAAGVPFFGVTECVKLAPTAITSSGELEMRLLHEWPRSADAPRGVSIRSEVLDWTPPLLVTAYITERGCLSPSEVSGVLQALFRELDAAAAAPAP